MAPFETMETTMENTVCARPLLKLVSGDVDDKSVALHTYCAKLAAHFQRFGNGAEKTLRPGMLAQWKQGMKNRTSPDYGVPAIVVQVLDTPIVDGKFDSGSVYFREPLDLVLGLLDDDDEFCLLHYDSHRFEPYAGAGTDQVIR